MANHYYRMGGRGGFKWGRHLYAGLIVSTTLPPEEAPEYFEPATELDYVNQERRRRGEKTFDSLPPKRGEEEAAKSVSETADGGSESEREAKIRNAISRLKGPEDWTESGRPRVTAVNEILSSWGVTPLTTAAEIQSVAPEARRPPASGGIANEA